MGYFWDELGKVKGANPAQFEQDQAGLHRAIEDLDSSRHLLQQLEAAELFGGQTDGSIAEAAKGLGAHLEELRDAAFEVYKADTQAQGAIQAAQNNYDGLPQSTEPNDFERFAAINPVVQVGSYIMSGQDFLSSVTAAREAERERQAKEALDALNTSLTQHREALSKIQVEPIEFAFVDEGGSWAGPVSPGDPIAPVPPRGSTPPSEGMPPGGPTPPGSGPVGSGPGPVGSVPPGGLPDADGDGVPDGVPVPDLAPGIPPAEEWPFRVYRPGDVSRDGPVDGGYSVPLNPRDGVLPRDPVWREMFAEHQRQAQARAGSGLGGLATAAGVAGLAAAGGRAGLGAAGAGARGVNLPGGVGAAGAAGARGVGVGSPGAGGLGPGARGVGVGGPGAGGLGAGARGVGVSSGAGLPGGGAGARGLGAGGVTPDGAGRAAGAGAGGAAGLRGAGGVGGGGLGSGVAGAGSAAGAGGARGMGGVSMGGAAGGAGGSEEKDKGRRRRKYGKSGVEFFSLSDPIDPGAAAGEGDAAGARLIDAPQREEGDRW